MATRMTSQIRQGLEARLAELDARIGALRVEAEDAAENEALARELARERDQIADALADAVLIDDAPFDKDAIEIGDVVTVRSRHGIVERFLLVDGDFASRLQDDWVSVASPLGAALVGRGTGDEIAFETPSGTASYLVLGFARSGGPGDAHDQLIADPTNPAA